LVLGNPISGAAACDSTAPSQAGDSGLQTSSSRRGDSSLGVASLGWSRRLPGISRAPEGSLAVAGDHRAKDLTVLHGVAVGDGERSERARERRANFLLNESGRLARSGYEDRKALFRDGGHFDRGRRLGCRIRLGLGLFRLFPLAGGQCEQEQREQAAFHGVPQRVKRASAIRYRDVASESRTAASIALA
jgi:hypothetical protein